LVQKAALQFHSR